MKKNAHLVLTSLILAFTGCNPGTDYIHYSTFAIYAANTKEIFTVFERESGNIYLPTGSHSNAGRNKEFSYYLMHTSLGDDSEYYNDVSELISFPRNTGYSS